MSSMTNGIGWFQIGAQDPDTAAKFYGTLFGWQFADSPSSGPSYRVITTPAGDSIQGGMFRADTAQQQHAMFCVQVEDVAASCVAAETAGGTVVVPPSTTPAGLTFADVLDPAGNLFGIYAPPARA
jgi:predicted enzyme related to lactoylglutathione lyase